MASSLLSTTQNELLLENLLSYYRPNGSRRHLDRLIPIVNGETQLSLRIIDWFVTNYAKKHDTVYWVNGERFKVYHEYKLVLRAFSKKRFDPFCRWDRLSIPTDFDPKSPHSQTIETTLGQLNFFKWAIENKVLEFIEDNFEDIENDMNQRNSTSRRVMINSVTTDATKTRKKREELSVSCSKCIKTEHVKISVTFS